MVGADDAHAAPDESRQIYAAAPGPKALWVVEGAVHQDLYRFAPDAYARRVLGFLEAHL